MNETVRSLLRRGFERTAIWVMAANPARAFYEKLGGIVINGKEFDILG